MHVKILKKPMIPRLKMSASPRHRAFHPLRLHSFSMKLPPSLFSSMKMKTLLHTLLSHLPRLAIWKPSLLEIFPRKELYLDIMMNMQASLSKALINTNTLIHTLIFPYLRMVIRSLIPKAKSFAVTIVKAKRHLAVHSLKFPGLKRNKKKSLYGYGGSYRFYFNWSSRSHVLPAPAAVLAGCYSSRRLYCDLARNSSGALYGGHHQCEEEITGETELSRYLQWLEGKVFEDSGDGNDNSINNIDNLAEMFIEVGHEKFILEKQESDRSFQEMMARSL
ncbi:uncharacterized protein LOC120287807 [Eucalyptus grandis]|uniref:uncharacterized protein LOC120287807 n=1 Tax=Eucalyptus grandis TaxID=71139 RepID=UPI0005253D83|nr:uncharacterized protein LOC120287807 [Eucalyptus grandis]